MEMLIGTPIVTNTPTASPTYAPCAVAAPTNGALGTCTSSLALGNSCQFSCSDGYGVSGPTSCSATTGLLAAATCTFEEAWTTVRAVPAAMTNVGQACAVVGTLFYTYATNFPAPAPTAFTQFQKYAATTDVWTTGAQLRLLRASLLDLCRFGAQRMRNLVCVDAGSENVAEFGYFKWRVLVSVGCFSAGYDVRVRPL